MNWAFHAVRRQSQERSTNIIALTVSIAVLSFVFAVGASVSSDAANSYQQYRDPMLAAGGLPPAKAALLQKEQDAVNAARANASSQSSTQVQAPAMASVAPAPYPTGISDSTDGPPPTEFLVKNAWHGPGGSHVWLAVFAGGARQHPGMDMSTQAAVRVMSMNPDPSGPLNLQDVGTFVAPGTASSLTISGVSGNVLNLITDAGKSLTFDVTTDTYG